MATQPSKLEQLAIQLKEISETLAKEETSPLSATHANRVRQTLDQVYSSLRKVMDDLDPIKHPGHMFDPSNPNVVGRIVGIAMIAQARKPLMKLDRFYGSGVYALYYNGDFPAYSAISKKEHPIYVGKADPINKASKNAIEQGDKLCGRLNEHSKNIARAKTTLRLQDFEYRALVVQTGWQSSAEQYLINLFKPIWNRRFCYGFGKHGDAPSTRANLRSPWDTIHPGRDWAHRDKKMMDARTVQQITNDIAEHLVKNPPLESIDRILRLFLDEMRAVS